MAKSKSGYKRPFNYQPPPGVKIEIRTQEAYQKLIACARANGCTIGQWAEANIGYVLRVNPFLPTIKRPPTTTPTSRPRSFQISESVYAEIERRFGEDHAKAWIARTLLALACIEIERQRGLKAEPDRFG